MKQMMLPGAVTVALTLTGLSLPAKAGFKVCNQTRETVDVAVVYVNRAGGVISEGWFEFRPCEDCGQLVSSSQTFDPHNYFFTRKVSKAVSGPETLTSA
jgi:uncharacterized membrane protein